MAGKRSDRGRPVPHTTPRPKLEFGSGWAPPPGYKPPAGARVESVSDEAARHAFAPLSPRSDLVCKHCDRARDDRIHACVRCGQRLDPRFRACSCVEPNADPLPARVECRTPAQLDHLPLSQWTDPEVLRHMGFILDSAAHLAGGFGALTPRHCMAFAARLRRIGGLEGEPQDG